MNSSRKGTYIHTQSLALVVLYFPPADTLTPPIPVLCKCPIARFLADHGGVSIIHTPAHAQASSTTNPELPTYLF